MPPAGRAIEDGERGRLVTLQSERHGAEAEARDGETGSTESDVAHELRE